jgi:hypothetical protein
MRSSQYLKNVVVTPEVREQINWRAYMMFVNSGGAHGNDLGHWLQAESEVLLERALTDPAAQHRA